MDAIKQGWLQLADEIDRRGWRAFIALSTSEQSMSGLVQALRIAAREPNVALKPLTWERIQSCDNPTGETWAAESGIGRYLIYDLGDDEWLWFLESHNRTNDAQQGSLRDAKLAAETDRERRVMADIAVDTPPTGTDLYEVSIP